MRKFLYLVSVVLLHFTSANPRQNRVQRQENDRNWDIRLAVPGEPGSDYPTLGNIPRTSFSCSGKEPGYYADVETNCQAFRVCTRGTTFGFQSFLCPNGTLFNQAVFVCDWWMNVNCDKSRELVNKNTEKFGNLQLGPQLMKDIKKMITFPMLNPYDKNIMRSNLIVMQTYVPPKGQMPMSAAFVNNFNSNIDKDFYQQKRNIVQSGFTNNDISFAASTPSSQYIPASNNRPQSPRNDAEVFQKQTQVAQFQNQAQKSRPQNTNNNRYSHTGKLVQLNSNNALPLSTPNTYQRNIQFTPSNNVQYVPPYQQGNNNKYFASQLANNPQQSHFVASKEFDMNFPIQYAPYPNFSPEVINSKGSNDLKQNLVSNNVSPSPIIAKSLTFDRVIQPKSGSPRSRITFKTWLVKPSRAKFTAGPYSYEPPPTDSNDNSESFIQDKPNSFEQIRTKTKPISAKISIDPNANTPTEYDQSYKYERPTQSSPENIIESTPYVYNKPNAAPLRVTQAGPYVYNKPTAAPQRVTQAGPYVYNKPTVAPQRVTQDESYVYNRPTAAPQRITAGGPYVYNKPTLPPKQISTKLTTPKPTLSGRLYLPPSSVAPTQPTRLYVPPITTYKPAVKLYLPPSSSSQPIILSNQYLPPQNEKLLASPSTPSPFFAQPENISTDSPSFSLTKHSRINANHNNLTFADILTKEKLDITVNDIVKATNKLLNGANTQKTSQYRLEEKYLPPEGGDSAELLTPASIINPTKSAKLVQSPSTFLEPPVVNSDHYNNNVNAIAKLPFYNNPTNPTIERTVSLKISIPEKIASKLFHNDNGSKLDTLEILTTGSSNYLVLANNQFQNTRPTTFIPIAKLVEDKNINYSDSQALVYKILQDSLNVAKEYSNVAQQSVLTTKDPLQNVNDEDYARITNNISHLTARQYSGNNNIIQNSIDKTPAQLATQAQLNEFQEQFNIVPSQQTTQQNSFSAQLKNQIYSGQLYQLPVPDITDQLNNVNQQIDDDARSESEVEHLQSFQNNNKDIADFEIIQSQDVSLPAKLQQEEQSINEHEINTNALIQSLINSGDGISAQVQDKIVGTIPHPSEHNKLVTYKNDKSYYVLTHNSLIGQTSNSQNEKLIQNNPNLATYQFLPSVSYQLNDEKDQDDILNTFQIDQYGQPKKLGNSQRLTQDVNLEVEHPSQLYSGPSSYSAPQSSVGNLESKQRNNQVSRIEQFSNPDSNANVGYA